MAKAYWIAQVEVTDPERFADYAKLGPGRLADFGGRFLARGGARTVMEGSAPERIVIIEFPSREHALAFYQSPDYQAARQHRLGAANCTFLVVDGLDSTPTV